MLRAVRAFSIILVAASVFTACGGSGGGSVGGAGGGSQAQLLKVEHGRLVDVYGLRQTAPGAATTVELFQADVLIGPDIPDERDTNSRLRDEEVTYDFISSNPDTLQPRLLITRMIGSEDFKAAYDALSGRLRLVAPGRFGQDVVSTPFSVVPRNAGIKLTFSSSLGIDDDFLVQRDDTGRIIGLKNTEAIQLLRIVGDPNDADPVGDFQVIPARFVPRGNTLIIDPVLLGSEGLQYQTRNNASGLPESPDQRGANIRIALALEGPLRIPGLREDGNPTLEGRNGANLKSIIRDFRSGNRNDDSGEISRGFVRDPIPPRIVGQIVMYLERVDDLDINSVVLTLYKGGATHEIDRGDVVRLVTDNSGIPFGVTEVIVDPADDFGQPAVQHVRVVCRRTPAIESIDPSNRQDYPTSVLEREPWLIRNAPRAVLVCEYTASRPENPTAPGDDPSNFLAFSPSPRVNNDGTPSAPTANISPFAGAIVRFTKPVDMATIRAFDTFFFGTRDLLDPAEVTAFRVERGIGASIFNHAKFVTPHLVISQIFDEDGSQTSIRLQPSLGFYLDERMRTATNPNAHRYFLHLASGLNGIKDLSGNPVDFQGTGAEAKDSMSIPFTVDTRKTTAGVPFFQDNLAVSIVRRFADLDEDPQPSYYIEDELPTVPDRAEAMPLQDVFGAVTVLSNGTLLGRPTSRVRQIVDDINQIPAPPQGSNPPGFNDLRYCPGILGEEQIGTATANTRFGAPIQNPLNPFGCRLQAVWREIDMSLSRTDPYDFNLDVEQMYWAPFTASPITYDLFDRVSLYLSHSEVRPEPCVGAFGALPTLPSSGLTPPFADNYAQNRTLANTPELGPQPHAAYLDQQLTIDQNLSFTEPNGVYRYLPLPQFQKPYFIWRDETVIEQGGNSRVGSDVTSATLLPYIVSPFLNGGGWLYRRVSAPGTGFRLGFGFWNNSQNFRINQTTSQDSQTGGLVGSIALPLMADFWTFPDSETLPVGNPFRASGANGWQISLAVTSDSTPNFRSYSGGGLVGGRPNLEDPSSVGWTTARGGYTPGGARTISADNSVYWVMADYLKRQTIATFGFVDIINPHRMPTNATDPRLGPFLTGPGQAGLLPRFSYLFEPSLDQLPSGTEVIPEFRGSGAVDPDPWYWAKFQSAFSPPLTKPTAKNFPLDPLKAGDAHIRKFDDRTSASVVRNGWTYFYNKNVTSYVPELNTLMDPDFTSRFAAPTEGFTPQDVKYFNWRFIMKNNVDATPAVTPVLESFAIAYRFERR